MKAFRIIFWSLLVVLLASCAHLVPPVTSTFKPDNNTTVVYARLDLEKNISLGNRLALLLRNTDLNKSVYMYFDRQKPVYAISVEPGHYFLLGFAGVDMTHRVLGQTAFYNKDLKKDFALSFEARTNSAVYIGDFVGCAKVNLLAEEWAIKSFTNNFVGTTVAFHKDYSNLTNIPVISIFDPVPNYQFWKPVRRIF